MIEDKESLGEYEEKLLDLVSKAENGNHDFSKLSPLEVLKKYFGYNEFRPMQLDIINHVLQKKDSLVLMPTGGGKSLCFQIPAIQLEGLTIVVSPLISLMKDQVDNLNANGIKAEFINSTLSLNDVGGIKEKLKRNEIKLLYVAPERLATEDFKIFLLMLNISLIAIDEAHCISEWGHDFRKDYRSLNLLKTMFPETPIIALTATATLKVREDILKQLNLIKSQTFISSFNRKNLNLVVTEKKKAFNKILSLVKKHNGEPTIIYCFSRKATEKITQKLKENGFGALPYHAGLSSHVRKNNQNLFIKDKVNIIVATIAFGMGIDKPDVRLVIHHTFSKSIEGYYQEIGRAGRDGLPSDCVLFYSKGDIRKHKFFLKDIRDHLTRNAALDKLNRMMAYCETTSCRRKTILEYLGESFSEQNCNGCDTCTNHPEIIGSTPNEKLVSEIVKAYTSYESNLFEKLRALRKRIATEKNYPPYIIFGDVSLREMALYLPKNNEEFLRIKGVGYNKLSDYGESFLEVINTHINENIIIPKQSFTEIEKIDIKTDCHKRLEQIKEEYPNAYEPWSEDEDDRLRKLFALSVSVSEIARILKRQPNAISSRLRKQIYTS